MFFRCDLRSRLQSIFFFFNDTATTEIYTLSLHDALPIFRRDGRERFGVGLGGGPLAIAQGLEQRTGGGESILGALGKTAHHDAGKPWRDAIGRESLDRHRLAFGAAHDLPPVPAG